MMSPAAPAGHLRYCVEAMDRRHLPQVAAVLRRAIPDSPLVGLGQGFLGELLNSYISIPGGCGYVAVQDGQVIGFVAGTENSSHHRRLLVRQRWALLMVQVAHGVTLSPRILGRLARYLLSNLPFLWPGRLCEGKPGEDEDSDFPPASLVLLAVDPAYHRRGIASNLTDAFLAEMASRGVKRMKVVVGAANKPALSFFLAGGWEMAGCFGAYDGRAAYRLVRATKLLAPLTAWRTDRAAA